MKQCWIAWLALIALGLAACLFGCDCGDDDDDNDDDPSDDDTAADDDTQDDDLGDDDAGDDDTADTYDKTKCEPFVEDFYGECHFSLEIDEQELTSEEALDSCQDYQYTFWPCAIDCFDDYGSACVDLLICLQGCFTE